MEQQLPAKLGYLLFDIFSYVLFGVDMMKVYFLAGQAFFNKFNFKFISALPSGVYWHFFSKTAPNIFCLLHPTKYWAFFFGDANQVYQK